MRNVIDDAMSGRGRQKMVRAIADSILLQAVVA